MTNGKEEHMLKTVIFAGKDKRLQIGDKVKDGTELMFAVEDEMSRLAMVSIGLWPYLTRSCIIDGVVDNLEFPSTASLFNV